MALFVVIAPDLGEQFEPLVGRLFPDDHFRIGNDAWVIAAKGLTSRQLSEKLEITKEDGRGPNGPAVIFPLKSSYWGRYNVSLWDWLKVKLESANA